MSQAPAILAEDVISDLVIPPQPDVLLTIYNELSNTDPDIRLISQKIIEDAGLFSSLLKLINSSFFGLRCEIRSVEHAISLLGLESLATIVASVKFRTEMNGSGYRPMPRYWDSSADTAKLCSQLSKVFGVAKPSEGYALGLFKDAGIPVLSRRFENYKNVLKQQNEAELAVYTQLEDEYFNTNHCVVGYLLTKRWGMAMHIRNACLYHHDIAYMTSESPDTNNETKKLLLISKIAEHVLNQKNNREDTEWDKIQDHVLFYFGISEHDYFELAHEMMDYMDGV